MISRAPEIEPAIVWTRSLFAEGALGGVYFPQALEGRVRHQKNAEQPLSLCIRRQPHQAAYKRAGIRTILELLKSPQADFDQLVDRGSERWLQYGAKIQQFFESQATGPEGFFIKRLFNKTREDLDPLPLRFEEARRQAVYQALDIRLDPQARKVNPLARAVLDLRFGLCMGFAKMEFAKSDELASTPAQVGAIIGSTKTRVQNIETGAFKLLRRSDGDKQLEQFLPYSEASIGRQVFGWSSLCELVEKYPEAAQLKLAQLESYEQIRDKLLRVFYPWFVDERKVLDLLANLSINRLLAKEAAELPQDILAILKAEFYFQASNPRG